MIPVGMTAYRRTSDIALNRPFKDHLPQKIIIALKTGLYGMSIEKLCRAHTTKNCDLGDKFME